MSDILNTYPGRCGEALDCGLNAVLFNGDPKESISRHSAREQKAGKRWACVMCRYLSATVEKDHCPKTLAGENISERAGLFAGLQLLALYLGITYGAVFGFLKLFAEIFR